MFYLFRFRRSRLFIRNRAFEQDERALCVLLEFPDQLHLIQLLLIYSIAHRGGCSAQTMAA